MNKIDVYKVHRFLDSFLVAFCSLYIDGMQRLTYEATIIPLWMWTFIIYYISSGNSKLYKSTSKRFVEIVGKLTTTWISTICLLLAILYLSKVSSTISRSSSVEWSLICMVITLITHIIIFRYTRRRKQWYQDGEKILVWANHASFKRLICKNEEHEIKCTQNIAWFSQDENIKEHNLGGFKEMSEWLKKNKPSKILFVQDKESSDLTSDLIKVFGNTSASVYILPAWYNDSMSLNIEEVYDDNFVRVWGAGKSEIDTNIKRSFDLLFSFITLLMLIPIFLIIGILIKSTSSGPIFFTQRRGGLNGREFKMIKFRSMYFYDKNKEENRIIQASKEDQRVTNIGKLMRKWSIDELPQLINVLKGEMTIVGPRPHAVQHDEKYSKLINGYKQRHSVKPGMTGLAQVRGFRGETRTISEMRNRVFSDLMYQRSWSLKNDIAIIIETISVLGSNKSY